MNSRTVSIVSKLMGKRSSDLARMAHVSRAAVSHWMKKPEPDIRARNLQALAENLGVRMDSLMHSLPLPAESERAQTLETSLLWDRLYPSLDDFAIALARRDPRALARLVQVYGLFEAEKIVGRDAWKNFPRYAGLMHPARRRQCESLCRELARHRLI